MVRRSNHQCGPEGSLIQRLQNEFPQSGFVDDALLQLGEVARKQGDLQRAIGIYSRLVAMQTSQLRGEAQDAMNHAVFAAPNANPAALNFGIITANAAPEQRRINIAAKFTW